MRNVLILIVILFFGIMPSEAQWRNRYPKVDGYGHHVYLEGYELPVMNSGPTDPTPSPSNDAIVFSSKGWLWLFNLSTLEATRITFSSGMDSRANWSPNGDRIVFVRDDGMDTHLVLLDMLSKKETIIVDTEALDLDPIFSKDGSHVYYASAKNGSFDLWKIDLSTLEQTAITNDKSLERLPVLTKNQNQLVYLKKKGFSYDSIELLNIEDGTSTPLAEENFASQMAFTLSPDDKTLAYTWPIGDNYELRLLNISIPKSNLLLTKSEGLPLSPKFSYDGQWIYFTESNKNESTELKRISINGGEVQNIHIKNWDWGIKTGKLKIVSKVDGEIAPVRMSITDKTGHPIIPETGIVHSEGQHGIVFFYSPGEIEIQAPLGEVTITTVHGFSTEKLIQKVNIYDKPNITEVSLKKIWDANANGWYSGDNHFHLNYGGTNKLDPEDIILDINAEDLDIAFPLLANLGNRFLEQNLLEWKSEKKPIIHFGQEVRSHFLGHLGLIGIKSLYWPWVWGPNYDIYSNDDRLNAEPLRFARNHNGLGCYVHPVSIEDPFTEKSFRYIPITLIPDAILGELDLIELGCLWTDEIGTASLWHELLNIGIQLGISGGSDVMNDIYRTMAVGSTRVYVKPKNQLSSSSYLEALKAGRSFVSNGPLLVFSVDEKGVGEVIKSKKQKVNWSLNVFSPISYEKIELFVNGEVVSTQKSKKSSKSTYNGSIKIPEGGWVTARVSGGVSDWPMMDSYPFAESSPIWFGEIGSTSSNSKIKAAQKLLMALNALEEELKEGYGANPIPNLLDQFAKAKEKLSKIIN